MNRASNYILASTVGFFITIFLITNLNKAGIWNTGLIVISAAVTVLFVTKAFAYKESEEYKMSTEYTKSKLLDLYELRKDGLISENEYVDKRSKVLDNM